MAAIPGPAAPSCIACEGSDVRGLTNLAADKHFFGCGVAATVVGVLATALVR